MGVAGSAFAITLIALLGGFGVLPGASEEPADAPAVAQPSPFSTLAAVPGSLPAALGRAATGDLSATTEPGTPAPASPQTTPVADPELRPVTRRDVEAAAKRPTVVAPPVAPPAALETVAGPVVPEGIGLARRAPSATAPGAPGAADQRVDPASTALPPGSGAGKRVVFDMGRQRVWLVNASGRVVSTYAVSGSLTDNLKPGRYQVFSRSEKAVGIDDSGTMRYFVRFTRGENAAIGFHDIPIDGGRPVQTKAQLGTPQSHGCIRQDRRDAIRLWDFAPLGTRVVVTP